GVSLIWSEMLYFVWVTRSNLRVDLGLDRISRLEAAIHSRKDTENEEQLQKVNDLQSKLEVANSELKSEKEKAQMLATENEKLQYRIIHLLRSLKNAELKLEQESPEDGFRNLWPYSNLDEIL
ncbi:hypothetical protein L195_g000551, partial [Trifolium pratense]